MRTKQLQNAEGDSWTDAGRTCYKESNLDYCLYYICQRNGLHYNSYKLDKGQFVTSLTFNRKFIKLQGKRLNRPDVITVELNAKLLHLKFFLREFIKHKKIFGPIPKQIGDDDKSFARGSQRNRMKNEKNDMEKWEGVKNKMVHFFSIFKSDENANISFYGYCYHYFIFHFTFMQSHRCPYRSARDETEK